MKREETLDAGVDRTRPPPPGSGIEVAEEADGTRITLPRLYSQGDVIVAVLAAAIAVWMAVWADALAADRAVSTFGWAVMNGIALFFGVLAVSQAVPVVAPRVIQDRGARIVLSRAVGARLLLSRVLPKSAVRSVERVWEEGEAEREAPGAVRIRTDRHAYRLGKELDQEATLWLEDALWSMVERGRRPRQVEGVEEVRAMADGGDLRVWSWLLSERDAGPDHVAVLAFEQERDGQLEAAIRDFGPGGFTPHRRPGSDGQPSTLWIDDFHSPRLARGQGGNLWVFSSIQTQGNVLRLENGYGGADETQWVTQTRLIHHLLEDEPGLRLVRWVLSGSETGPAARGETGEGLLDHLRGSREREVPRR